MKTRQILLLFCTIIAFLSCKSSHTNIGDKNANYIPYYLKVYEADSLYLIKDFEGSFNILDSLFEKYEPINMQTYYEYEVYNKLKIILKKDLTNDNFLKLVSDYGVVLTNIKNDSIYEIYYNKNKKIIEEKYSYYRERYVNRVNIDLRARVKEMMIDDQKFRSNYDSVKQNKNDSINSFKIKKIFKTYGYPNEKIIGNYNFDLSFAYLGTILLHTNDHERINYFLPKIHQFVYNGTALPTTYANMKDQYEIYNGKPQYYGTYTNKTDININLINIRRKDIGLPNYGYEKWRYNILFPNEEY